MKNHLMKCPELLIVVQYLFKLITLYNFFFLISEHQISNFSFLESSDEEQNEKGNNFRRDNDEEEVPDSKLFYKRPQQNKNALRSRGM